MFIGIYIYTIHTYIVFTCFYYDTFLEHNISFQKGGHQVFRLLCQRASILFVIAKSVGHPVKAEDRCQEDASKDQCLQLSIQDESCGQCEVGQILCIASCDTEWYKPKKNYTIILYHQGLLPHGPRCQLLTCELSQIQTHVVLHQTLCKSLRLELECTIYQVKKANVHPTSNHSGTTTATQNLGSHIHSCS